MKNARKLINVEGCAIQQLHDSHENSCKFKKMATGCKNDKTKLQMTNSCTQLQIEWLHITRFLVVKEDFFKFLI